MRAVLRLATAALVGFLLISAAGAAQANVGSPTGPYEVIVNRHGVLLGTNMPRCATEDANGPCMWNAHEEGNHRGLSYWVGTNNRVHYFWPHNPAHNHWQWIPYAVRKQWDLSYKCVWQFNQNWQAFPVRCPNVYGEFLIYD